MPFPSKMCPALTLLLACCVADPPADPCEGGGALASSVSPDRGEDWYVEQSLAYFDTMDAKVPEFEFPDYGETVARWEWPPWLKLTAYTRDGIEASDTLLRLFPSTVPERECRFFDMNPFGRCRVVFYYDAYPGQPCPIYEEFTFDQAGHMTWIETWSDLDGMRPMAEGDAWAESQDVYRLATVIPGLGTPSGQLDIAGAPMKEASSKDPNIADFAARAEDWTKAWIAE